MGVYIRQKPWNQGFAQVRGISKIQMTLKTVAWGLTFQDVNASWGQVGLPSR